MYLEITGIILTTIGTVLIGIAALRVHHNVLVHKDIDEHVLRTMQSERTQGYLGMVLVVTGNALLLAELIL